MTKNIHCFYFVIFENMLLALFWVKFLNKIWKNDERLSIRHECMFTVQLQIVPSY